MTPQASPNRTTLTWLVPITLLVAVCALVGGLIARQVYAVTKTPDSSAPPASSAPVSTSPSQATAPDTVSFTDFAKGDPQFDKVRITIQNYFNGTNHQDYNTYRQAVTASVLSQQTQSQWLGGLKDTKDRGMTVYRIEATDQGADVFGSFTSTQDISAAPDDLQVGCINWWMVWKMVNVNGGLRIDGTSVVKKACPA